MLASLDAFHAAPCPRCCGCSSSPAIYQSDHVNVRLKLPCILVRFEHHPLRSNLELLWALGCLVGSSAVPFPQDECRALFKNLLQYIDTTYERYTIHALLCCLDVVVARLSAPPAAGSSAAPGAAADSPQHMEDKQLTIKAILKLLTHVRIFPYYCLPFCHFFDSHLVTSD